MPSHLVNLTPASRTGWLPAEWARSPTRRGRQPLSRAARERGRLLGVLDQVEKNAGAVSGGQRVQVLHAGGRARSRRLGREKRAGSRRLVVRETPPGHGEKTQKIDALYKDCGPDRGRT